MCTHTGDGKRESVNGKHQVGICLENSSKKKNALLSRLKSGHRLTGGHSILYNDIPSDCTLRCRSGAYLNKILIFIPPNIVQDKCHVYYRNFRNQWRQILKMYLYGYIINTRYPRKNIFTPRSIFKGCFL